MAAAKRFGLDEVGGYFQDLEGPRSEVNRKHSLASVAVIAPLAVLAGASGPTMIAEWAALKEELLPSPHGVPCKVVFRRVLMALNPETLQEWFAAWVRSLRGRPWRSTPRPCDAATTARTAWGRCLR